MGRDPFHQPRVLPAPSNLALSTAREGAATASLGSLGQGLTTLRVKNSFLISHLNLPSFSLKPLPVVLSSKMSDGLILNVTEKNNFDRLEVKCSHGMTWMYFLI